MKIKNRILLVALSYLIIACSSPAFMAINNKSTSIDDQTNNIQKNTPTSTLTPLPVVKKSDPSLIQQPISSSPTPTPTATAAQAEQAVGPVNYPAGVNPLTGLAVDDPSWLDLPPALLSITNWPPSARPQAGLSYTPLVFELYIGEGMSRFLALFYGDFPQGTDPGMQPNDPNTAQNYQVGPLRSGRLPYQSLRQFYNGFLVMASAFSGVMQNLSEYNNFFGSDADDINSAMIDVSRLESIAKASDIDLGENALQGMLFDPQAPAGGQDASDLWYIYNAIDMVNWKYDPASGAYHRYQDNADGKTFTQASDRLNDQALTYENVVVLFATHRMCNDVAYDIDLISMRRAPALLFRDGKMYKIFWTTWGEEYEKTTGKLRPIRFIDENGDPFAFKPGQTWIHLTPLYTPYWESIDSNIIFDLLNKKEEGSGVWVTRFYASQMIYDEAVCDQLR